MKMSYLYLGLTKTPFLNTYNLPYMKPFTFTIVFSFLFLGVLVAQQKVSGEYFIQTSQGEIVMKLQYTSANQVVGSMVDANGTQYQLKGQDEDGDVFGTISNASGSTYFEAYREENQLIFSIIPPDASGQPDHSKANEFTLTYRGGGDANTTASSQNGGGLGFGRSEAGGLSGPMSSTGSNSAGQWSGDFNGNIAGTPSVLSLTQNGSQISGKIDAGGYIYNIQGSATGNQAQGQVSDPQTGGGMAFQATLQGGAVNMNLSANGQQLNLQFSKGGAPQQSIGQAYNNQQPGGMNNSSGNANPASLDQRVVGNWLYTESNSGGGFSFAAQWRLILQPNGTYVYGDGKIAGGGAGVSGSSGGGGVQSQGQWKTENSVIYINEGAGWQAYARYYVEGASMMFTFGDGSKQVWKRSY